MMNDIWRGRRVLLTGHTGFKGGWLALCLQHLGAKVVGISLPPLSPSMYDAAGIAQCTDGYFVDIRDAKALAKIVGSVQPEIIFHLAAQPLVRNSYLDPLETYSTNVMGTANLLEAVRVQSPETRAIVVVTTDKCYENREWVWGYRETDSLGGHDPYSSSKAGAELVAHSYSRSFFNNAEMPALATARAGNVIGGGDFAVDRLLPDLLQACEKKKNLFVRYPNAIRPWQHVLEPLAGYLRLAASLYQFGKEYSGAWNFGPTEASLKPVSWVVDHFIDRWGSRIKWESHDSGQLHESGILKLDSSKAAQFLGWRSRMGLEQAIEWVISWHKAQLAGEEMQRISNLQIAEFISYCSEFKDGAHN